MVSLDLSNYQTKYLYRITNNEKLSYNPLYLYRLLNKILQEATYVRTISRTANLHFEGRQSEN